MRSLNIINMFNFERVLCAPGCDRPISTSFIWFCICKVSNEIEDSLLVFFEPDSVQPFCAIKWTKCSRIVVLTFFVNWVTHRWIEFVASTSWTHFPRVCTCLPDMSTNMNPLGFTGIFDSDLMFDTSSVRSAIWRLSRRFYWVISHQEVSEIPLFSILIDHSLF